jgi:phage head maturation protease
MSTVGELKRKDFVVSDESINSYGFTVLSNGVVFAKHLPAFFEHDLTTDPIGHWENVRKEGVNWMATLVYGGNSNPDAQKVYDLIDSGHIGQASLGIDLSPRNTEFSADNKVITRAFVLEISIVKIASNRNAIALYDGSLKKTVANINLNAYLNECKMPKKVRALLNLSDNATDAEVAQAIELLQKKTTDVNNELLTLKANQQKNSIKEVLDGAGVTGEERTLYEKLMETDFDNTKKVLELRPKPTPALKLSSIPAPVEDSGEVKYKGKTFAELRKENPTLLQKLKNENLSVFKLMYKSEYGVEWKD